MLFLFPGTSKLRETMDFLYKLLTFILRIYMYMKILHTYTGSVISSLKKPTSVHIFSFYLSGKLLQGIMVQIVT